MRVRKKHKRVLGSPSGFLVPVRVVHNGYVMGELTACPPDFKEVPPEEVPDWPFNDGKPVYVPLQPCWIFVRNKFNAVHTEKVGKDYRYGELLKITSKDKRWQIYGEAIAPEWWKDVPRPVDRETFYKCKLEAKRYVTFPNLKGGGKRVVVSDEKLVPIVRKLVSHGIYKISYEGLLGLLGM